MANVITYLKQKTGPSDYIDLPIGPEVRYVGPQRNSNNNNLEEQLVLGTDYQLNRSISIDPNNDQVVVTQETISFKDNSSDNNYYKLLRTEKKEISTIIDSSNKLLVLNLNPSIVSETEDLYYHSTNDIEIHRKTVTPHQSGFIPGEDAVIGAIPQITP